MALDISSQKVKSSLASLTEPSGSIISVDAKSARTTLEYPPAELTANTTTITSGSYGTGTYVASSSTEYFSGAFPASRAFESTTLFGSDDSFWHSASGNIVLYNQTTGSYLGTVGTLAVNGTTYNGDWIQLQLPESIKLTSFSILPRQEGSLWVDRSPNTFVILGSNNGISWNLVNSQSGINNWTTTSKTFTVNSNKSYNYYRLVTSVVGNGTQTRRDSVQIARLRLYGESTSSTAVPISSLGMFLPSSIVQDGLIAHIDPSNLSSYGGSGGTLYNLVDGSTIGTLGGTYNTTTGGIRLTNSSSDANLNVSYLQLGSLSNVTTISIWYYQHSALANRYLLDGRSGGDGGWIWSGGPNTGSNWDAGTLYKNGGSNQLIIWSNIETVGVWQNVTLIADTRFTDDITLFAGGGLSQGLDITVGPILIYNRAITRAENESNFNAIRARYSLDGGVESNTIERPLAYSSGGYNNGSYIALDSTNRRSLTNSNVTTLDVSAGGGLTVTALARMKSISEITAATDGVYPPVALTGDTTGVTGQSYGNGIYTVSTSFTSGTTSVNAFDKSNTTAANFRPAAFDNDGILLDGVAYPPGVMTGTSTSFSGLSSANGLYRIEGSSVAGGTSLIHAFDDDVNTYWESAALYDPVTGDYLGSNSLVGFSGESLTVRVPFNVNLKSVTITCMDTANAVGQFSMRSLATDSPNTRTVTSWGTQTQTFDLTIPYTNRNVINIIFRKSVIGSDRIRITKIAFNNQDATSVTDTMSTVHKGEWIGLQTPNSIAVKTMSLTASTGGNIRTFALLGSNNGTNWDLMYNTPLAVTLSSSGSSFLINSSTFYNQFRLIAKTSSTSNCSLRELSFTQSGAPRPPVTIFDAGNIDSSQRIHFGQAATFIHPLDYVSTSGIAPLVITETNGQSFFASQTGGPNLNLDNSQVSQTLSKTTLVLFARTLTFGDNATMLTYQFIVPVTGTYNIQLQRLFPNGNNDSFWVSLNGASAGQDSGYVSSHFIFRGAPAGPIYSNITLTAGTHTLVIQARETGALGGIVVRSTDGKFWGYSVNANSNLYSAVHNGDSVYPRISSIAIPAPQLPTGAVYEVDVRNLTLSTGSSVSQIGRFTQSVASQRPTYTSSGGYKSFPYMSFNRTASQFLEAPMTTFNIATNGGFTAMALVRFTGTAGVWERIFESGNAINTPDNNIILTRNVTTTNLTFSLRTGLPEYQLTRNSSITQNSWQIFGFRYSTSNNLTEIFVNGSLATSGTSSVTLTNRTQVSNFIGRSTFTSDAYSNMDFTSLYVYDRALSDTEMTSLYRYVTEPISRTAPVTLDRFARYTLTYNDTTSEVRTYINNDLVQTDTAIAVYPPQAMTANTTSISGAVYGNGSYIASASGDNGSGPFNVFDKNTGSRWVSDSSIRYTTNGTFFEYNGNGSFYTNGYGGEWLQIQMPVAIRLSKITLNSFQDRSPRNFKIFGSTDGSTWTDIYTGLSVPWTTQNTQTFIVNSTSAFNYYRLVINTLHLGIDGRAMLYELQLYGTEQITSKALTRVSVGRSLFNGGTNSDLDIADLKVYPRELSQRELRQLSQVATKPSQIATANITEIEGEITPAIALDARSLDLLDGTRISDWNGYTQSTDSQRPTYRASGGYNGSPYVEFRKGAQQFLSGPAETLRINSNGGFTIAGIARFPSDPTNEERIVELTGGGTLSVRRNGTSRDLLFESVAVNNSTDMSVVTTNNVIYKGEWVPFAARYNATSNLVQIYKGTSINSTSTASATLTDRAFTGALLGKSSGEIYSNLDLAGLWVYDRALSDRELAKLYNSITTGVSPVSNPTKVESSLNSTLDMESAVVSVDLSRKAKLQAALGRETPLEYPPDNRITGNVTNVTGADYGNGVYVCSASSVLSNPNDFSAFRAFESSKTMTFTNVDNFWHSADSGSTIYNATTGAYASTVTTIAQNGISYPGEWLQIELPNQIVLTSYTILPRGDSNFWLRRSPNTFVILGSNDGLSWNLVDTESGINWTSAAKTFTISGNSVAYSKYRLVTSVVGNSNQSSRTSVQISRWRLFGSPVVWGRETPHPPAPLTANSTTISSTSTSYAAGTYTASASSTTTGSAFTPFGMSNTLVSGRKAYWESSLSFNSTTGGYSSAATSWVSRTSPTGGSYRSVAWSSELGLFAAPRFGGSGDNIIISPDGIDWTTRSAPNTDNQDIIWVSELSLFVSVGYGANSVMTSPDGITWTSRTCPNNFWRNVCWSPELRILVCTAIGNTTNDVMTSPDGINWTLRTTASGNTWDGVCWSPELSLFAAVSSSIGVNTRVMTSPDGINWTLRSTPNLNNSWRHITWSSELGLFVAVSSSGSGSNTMTSSDGIVWTGRHVNGSSTVIWIKELSLFVGISGGLYIISSNGVNWTSFAIPNSNVWSGLCYAPELNLMVAVADSTTGNIIMTSGGLGSESGEFLQLQLPRAIAPRSFNLLPRQDSTLATQRSPRYFLLLGSNNGTTWDVLYKGDNVSWSTAAQEFFISNPKSSRYNYFRLLTTRVGNAGITSNKTSLQIAGMTFKEVGILHGASLVGSSITSLGDLTQSDPTKAPMQITASTILEFPPQPLTSNTTTISGADYSNGVYTASASTTNGQNAIQNAFTGSSNLIWESGTSLYNSTTGSYNGTVGTTTIDGTIYSGEYLEIAVPQPIKLSSFRILPSSTSTSAPRDFYVLGSNDGSTWNLVSTHTQVTDWTASQKTFSINSSVSYTTFRLVTTKVGAAASGSVQIARWQLFGTISESSANFLAFNASKEHHLTIPSKTLNISTNGGFTALARVRFTGIPASNESIFKLGEREIGNLEFLRTPSGNLGIKSRNIPTTQEAIVSISAGITRTTPANNTWTTIVWAPELSLFVAIGASGTGNRVMTSGDGVTWVSRTTPVDNEWSGLAWSKELSLFVAISNSGSGNRVMTSPDGITWVSRTTPADNNWATIVWAPELSLFVAVGSSGIGNRVMTSQDGIRWTTRTTPATNLWYGLAWAPELRLFAAVAGAGSESGNRVMTSPDGINWTTRTSPSDSNWVRIAWSPELRLFAAVNNDATSNGVMTSSDGIIWTLRTTPTVGHRNITWASEIGMFLVACDSGTGTRLVTSSDGITWTARTTPVDNVFRSIAWAPQLGIFAMVSDSGTGNRVVSSTSVYNGVDVTTNGLTTYSSKISGNDNLTIGYNSVGITSSAGVYTYTMGSGDTNSTMVVSNLRSLVGGHRYKIDYTVSTTSANVYLAFESPSFTVLQRSPILSSTFTSYSAFFTAPSTNDFFIRVIGGPSVRLSWTDFSIYSHVSNNAISSWTARTTPVDNNWRRVAWSPKLLLFVAISETGTGNRIMTSTDGYNWTQRSSPQDNSWKDIIWVSKLGLFVAVSNDGTNRVMTSPDGITWTLRTAAEQRGWYSLAWSPTLNLLVAVGQFGYIMTSPDAITWTSRTSPSETSWRSIVWAPKLSKFISTGFSSTNTNDTMTSSDGITWLATTSSNGGFDWWTCSWSDELSIAIALSQSGSKAMSSPDGITWTERTLPVFAAWYGSSWSSELSLFVAVGINQIIYSSNGTTWNAVQTIQQQTWYGITWSPELGIFVVVAQSGTGSRVLTSTLAYTYSNTSIPQNEFVTLAARYQRSTGIVTLSNNGKIVSKTSATGTLGNLTVTGAVAKTNGLYKRHANMDLSSLYIFDRALSDAELTDLHDLVSTSTSTSQLVKTSSYTPTNSSRVVLVPPATSQTITGSSLSQTFTLTDSNYGNGTFTVTSSSRQQSGREVYKMFVSSANEFWNTGSFYNSTTGSQTSNLDPTGSGYLGEWAKIQLPYNFRLTSYSIKAYNSGTNRCPRDFALFASNDNNTWTKIDERTNQIAWGSNENRRYSTTNMRNYKFYIIVINRNNNDTQALINKMSLYGIIDPTTTNESIQTRYLKLSKPSMAPQLDSPRIEVLSSAGTNIASSLPVVKNDTLRSFVSPTIASPLASRAYTPIQNGLIAWFDPNDPLCYSGSGATLGSLVGTGISGTLGGTSSFANGTIRLTNSSVFASSNTSRLNLTSLQNITTVSIWYYQHSAASVGRTLLDMRTGGVGGWIWSDGNGSNWSAGTLYKNGSTSASITWSNIETVGRWQNVTVIANNPATDDITLFSNHTNNTGLDVTFGPILVYNRAITQQENEYNFNAVLASYFSAPNPAVPITNGLIAWFDPSDTRCYSGTGATLGSLIPTSLSGTGGTLISGTVGGTYNYNATSGAIRLTNSSATSASNVSYLQLESLSNITTVSIWYYQHSASSNRYLLDGRTGATGGWLYNEASGLNWTSGTLYKNGGSAQITTWSNIESIGAWQNITVIANESITDDITVFARSNLREGLDVTFGPILIYNRALTEAENRTNYETFNRKFLSIMSQRTQPAEFPHVGKRSLLYPPIGLDSDTTTISSTSTSYGSGTYSLLASSTSSILSTDGVTNVDSRSLTLANGASVSNWSGFTQGTTANQPVYYNSGGFNGMPYVRFTGANSQWIAGGLSGDFNIGTNGGYTVLALFKFNGPIVNFEQILQFGGSGNRFFLGRLNTTGNVYVSQNDGTERWVEAIPVSQNEWTVISHRFNSTTNLAQMYKNNILTKSVTIPGTFGNTIITDSQIGRLGANNLYSNMDLGGVYVYDRPLSDTELTTAYNNLTSFSVAYNALDGSAGSYWTSAAGGYNNSTGAYSGTISTTDVLGNTYSGDYLEIRTPEPLYLTGMSVAPNTTTFATSSPTGLTLLGSRNGMDYSLLMSTSASFSTVGSQLFTINGTTGAAAPFDNFRLVTSSITPSTREYPPMAMTVDSTNITSASYGTGTYVASMSSNYYNSSFLAYDKSLTTSPRTQYYYDIEGNYLGNTDLPPGNMTSGTITIPSGTVGVGTYILTASSDNGTDFVYNACDGNVSTVWTSAATYNATTGSYTGNTFTTDTNSNQVLGEWIQIELPNVYTMTSARLTFHQTNFNSTAPKTVVFACSDSLTDGTWGMTSPISITSPGTSTRSINIPANVTRRYWRMIITEVGTSSSGSNQDRVQLSEFRLRCLDTPRTTTDTSSTVHSGEWYQLTLPSSRVMKSLNITAGDTFRTPSLFALLGSNNQTTWDLLYNTPSELTWTQNTTPVSFGLTTTMGYSIYRLVAKKTKTNAASVSEISYTEANEGDVSLSEVQLFGGTVNSSRALLAFPPASMTANTTAILNTSYGSGTYVATASSNAAQLEFRAFDNSIWTYWHTRVTSSNLYNSASGIYIGTVSMTAGNVGYAGEWLQLQTPNLITVDSISIAPRQDNNLWLSRSPNTFHLFGSRNGNVWDLVKSFSNVNNWTTATKYFTVDSSRSYNYFRILTTIVGTSGDRNTVQIAEWKLYGNETPNPIREFPPGPMSADSTTLSGYPYGEGVHIASASGTPRSGEENWRAFDGLTTTYWHSTSPVYNASTGIYEGTTSMTVGSVGYAGEWIQLQTPNSIKLSNIAILPRQDNSLWTSRSPNTFYLFGSTNGTTWEVINEFQNINDWTQNVKNFSIETSKSYDYFRILTTIAGQDNFTQSRNSLQIAEISLYGEELLQSSYTITDLLEDTNVSSIKVINDTTSTQASTTLLGSQLSLVNTTGTETYTKSLDSQKDTYQLLDTSFPPAYSSTRKALSQLFSGHNDSTIAFGGEYNGSFTNTSITSPFAIRKGENALSVQLGTMSTSGSALSFSSAITVSSSGSIQFGSGTGLTRVYEGTLTTGTGGSAVNTFTVTLPQTVSSSSYRTYITPETPSGNEVFFATVTNKTTSSFDVKVVKSDGQSWTSSLAINWKVTM
jgi:hypothetical protein